MAEKVYALDEGGNRIETLSAEQILEAIETAIKTGEIPAELQTFIDTIREQNKGAGLKFWLGTQAEFLALESTSEDVIYFINDSTNLRDVADALTKLSEQLKDGSFKVKKAEAADSAANVSEKINSKAVTDIFEKDGVTAKKATKAEAADSAKNAIKVNNLEIKCDENGVLKIGDTIIPQKRVLWEGSVIKEYNTGRASFDIEEDFNLSAEKLKGKKIEIEYSLFQGLDNDFAGNCYAKLTFRFSEMDSMYFIVEHDYGIGSIETQPSGSFITFYKPSFNNMFSVRVSKIMEIIE